MESILVHRDEISLKLTFDNAFHPSKLNIKADHWYPKYNLSLIDNSFEFKGWFTGQFWYLNNKDLIVFEEYVNQTFDSESIKYDGDIELRLFLIDFKRSAVTKFSRLRNGRFDVLKLTEDERIIYLKKQHDKTGEFEINLNSLEFELISRINNN